MKYSWMTAGLFGVTVAVGCTAPPADLDKRVSVDGRLGTVSQAESSACFSTDHDGARAWIDSNCSGNGGTYAYTSSDPDGNHCMSCNSGGPPNSSGPGYPSETPPPSLYFPPSGGGGGGGGGSGVASEADALPQDSAETHIVCAALAAAVVTTAGYTTASVLATGGCAAGMLVTLGAGEPICLIPAASALVMAAATVVTSALVWALCEKLPYAVSIPATPTRITQENCNACPLAYWGPRHTGHVHRQCTDIVAGHSHWMEYNQTADCTCWGPEKNINVTLCY